jgi:hypothetical protein
MGTVLYTPLFKGLFLYDESICVFSFLPCSIIKIFLQHSFKLRVLPVAASIPVVSDGCVSGACVYLFIHD